VYETGWKYTLDLVPMLAQGQQFASRMVHSARLRSQLKRAKGLKEKREVLALRCLQDCRLSVVGSRDLYQSHCCDYLTS
jgi:hypothetical protein